MAGRSPLRGNRSRSELLTYAVYNTHTTSLRKSSGLLLSSLLDQFRYDEVILVVTSIAQLVPDIHRWPERDRVVDMLIEHDTRYGDKFKDREALAKYFSCMNTCLAYLGEVELSLEFFHDLVVLECNNDYEAWFSFAMSCYQAGMLERCCAALEKALLALARSGSGLSAEERREKELPVLAMLSKAEKELQYGDMGDSHMHDVESHDGESDSDSSSGSLCDHDVVVGRDDDDPSDDEHDGDGDGDGDEEARDVIAHTSHRQRIVHGHPPESDSSDGAVLGSDEDRAGAAGEEPAVPGA